MLRKVNKNRVASYAEAIEKTGGRVIDSNHFETPDWDVVTGFVSFTGNGKIDKECATTSIKPIETCPGCCNGDCDCSKTCYAKRPYEQYPECKVCWDKNTECSIIYHEFFKAVVIYQLYRSGRKYCRVHVAGDMYSAKYVNLWREIAAELRCVKFFTYTKSFGCGFDTELKALDNERNFNFVKSVLPNGKINYGNALYLEIQKALLELAGHKVFVCPCGTDAGKDVKCGKTCHACATHEYVLFHGHGGAFKAQEKREKKLADKYIKAMLSDSRLYVKAA